MSSFILQKVFFKETFLVVTRTDGNKTPFAYYAGFFHVETSHRTPSGERLVLSPHKVAGNGSGAKFEDIKGAKTGTYRTRVV